MNKAVLINKTELLRACSLAMSRELSKGTITLDDVDKISSVLVTMASIVIDNPELIEQSLEAIAYEPLQSKEEDENEV